MTLALIDYGAGNLHSVANALKAAGAGDVVITADADVVARADRIVLPGVGAFAACASALRAVPGMVEAMERRVRGDGVPFLGICVGMQLLAETGEEFGVHAGLGWIAGSVRRLTPADPAAKVPHMGWNDVVPVTAHPLIVPGEAYFLHSYAFEGADVVATSDHAGPVVAAIGRDNILGVQFHPEKSQVYGLQFLRRFLTWAP
ncbi:imidazole glycerol phosphate synthase subunit HisH [Sphingomonas populi]|uniref:Imidazole glycerol phosphate synthase subunit HisH n=1 Tax=Sphingomonas populi TaxID=2484750 RepID=A0A4Q6XTR1_9SPHN|nr:imidazole glycerol phosphate synthase subunit HisH [Sphingomonas populi]RZF60982.1 imidazole glycerol phosphate synthase subunit HisH [Sphingomonas populi]